MYGVNFVFQIVFRDNLSRLSNFAIKRVQLKVGTLRYEICRTVYIEERKRKLYLADLGERMKMSICSHTS